eukprot:GFYU01001167.1.p1 GENE.GFYU01001167.1~~GFYU01001167.1.p1  ORF type:complete len:369 (+),score=77.82 GFYU01001167.1:130-1236(+)
MGYDSKTVSKVGAEMLKVASAASTSSLVVGAVVVSGIYLAKKGFFRKKKEAYSHRGVTCDRCKVTPIRGVRFKCSNCVAYDLCQECEKEHAAIHDKRHVFLKIHIPLPAFAYSSRPLLTSLYPGHLSMEDLNPTQLKALRKGTHFDKVELQALFDQYKAMCVSKGGIDKETFENGLGPLGLEKNILTDTIFNFFDRDQNGMIDFAEFVGGLSIICKGTAEEKIHFAFRAYDLDHDGFITLNEMHSMFKAYFNLSFELARVVAIAAEDSMLEKFDEKMSQPLSTTFSLPPSRSNNTFEKPEQEEEPKDAPELEPVMKAVSDEAISELVNRAFAKADKDKDFKVSYDEFRQWASEDPTLVEFISFCETLV